MMKRLSALAIFLLASGCAGASRETEKKQMLSEKDACLVRLPPVAGGYKRLATCIDTAELQYASKVPSAYAEANDRMQARDIIARKIDDKEMSVEDGKAEQKKEFLAIAASQREQAAEDASERRQRAAAYMLMSGASHPQPIYQAPTPSIYSPSTTNCTSFVSGSYINTNCTH